MNPVLINDLRKSLFRRKPVAAVAYAAIAILVLVFGVSTTVPLMSSWQLRQFPVWRFPDLVLPFLAPMFAAGSFAKEHEQRTWQDVLLTRLTGAEILAGKFFSCYFPTLVALVVLFPPFALILIIQGVSWAMDPGFWMIELAMKVLVAVTFYVAISLVVSYHSPNARVALAVTYAAIVTYAILNYMAWTYVLEPALVIGTSGPWGPQSQQPWSSGDSDQKTFSLSGIDWLLIFQAGALGLGLLSYLALRLRERRE